MRGSLSVLLLFLSCNPGDASVGDLSVHAAASKDETEEQEWDRVLEIAGSGSPAAKQQLDAIRAHSQNDRVKTLATKILFLWDDGKRTYEAAEPRPVDRECLPISTLKELLGETGEMVRLDVEVTVSPQGRAESVKILGGTPDDERLRGAVEKRLMEGRFVPRHTAGQYERGVARIECKAHVR